MRVFPRFLRLTFGVRGRARVRVVQCGVRDGLGAGKLFGRMVLDESAAERNERSWSCRVGNALREGAADGNS